MLFTDIIYKPVAYIVELRLRQDIFYKGMTYDWDLVKVSSNSVGTLLNYRKAPISHVYGK